MKEAMVKTHLIIKSIDNDYSIKWCGRVKDVQPLMTDGVPHFVVRTDKTRVEVSTTDMRRLEEIAKRITQPKGREAWTQDKAYILITDVNHEDHLLGTVVHNRIKHFAPMYDAVGYEP